MKHERYQIKQLLGQSRSSHTYLALDILAQTPCVLKQIKLDSCKFEATFQQLRALQHPQIPGWIDVFEEQDYLCWVQEYIVGEPLSEYLKRSGKLTVTELWHVLEQTLPIVQYLHRQEIQHGDIRPENLIARAGLSDLVLVDLAVIPTGNPEYAAPEQLRGQPQLASDLYSLGLTSLHLLTGLRPIDCWTAANPSHWRDYWLPEPSDPGQDRLAQFLDRLLMADPAQRFTAAEAIAALEQIRGRKLRGPATGPATGPVCCVATLSGQQGSAAGVNAVAVQNYLLASASDDKSIRLWQLPTGAACGELLGHQGAVKAVAFQPQAQVLASGSQDRSIKLWNCETQQLIQSLTGHSSAVNALTFSPDGQILASGSSDKTVKLWHSGECITTLSGHRLAVNAIAFSSDGKQIATASTDGTVRLWNAGLDTRGECLQVLSGHTQAVRAVAFSPTGLLASGGGTIRLWNLATGDSRALSGHPWAISGLLFSSDGQYLLSASWDKTIKIWQVQTGEEIGILKGHIDAINAITLSDNLIISASKDKTIKLWKMPESMSF